MSTVPPAAADSSALAHRCRLSILPTVLIGIVATGLLRHLFGA